MKAFWTYTLARLGVLLVCLAVVWLVASQFFEQSEGFNIVVILASLVLSSVISVFLLSGLRNNLAQNVQDRATRMTERIEESRRAEDID